MCANGFAVGLIRLPGFRSTYHCDACQNRSVPCMNMCGAAAKGSWFWDAHYCLVCGGTILCTCFYACTHAQPVYTYTWMYTMLHIYARTCTQRACAQLLESVYEKHIFPINNVSESTMPHTRPSLTPTESSYSLAGHRTQTCRGPQRRNIRVQQRRISRVWRAIRT